MANRDCVAAVFESKKEGNDAISELLARGFSNDRLSLIQGGDEDELLAERPIRHNDEMERSAVAGATAGAATGLLAGSSLFLIPGLGPVLIAGAMASGLTGGIVGGLIGAMSGWGIKRDRLEVYEELVRAGKTVILVTGAPDELADAKAILMDSPAEQVTLHAETADPVVDP